MSIVKEPPNKKGGRRIIYKLNVMQTKEGSSATYVRLEGLIAVPTILVKNLTRRELFIFLQNRKIVGEASLLDEGNLG
ncbi:MAG: hypothetical protein WC087_01275 [Candidatus Paceibacterota bacterium]